MEVINVRFFSQGQAESPPGESQDPDQAILGFGQSENFDPIHNLVPSMLGNQSHLIACPIKGSGLFIKDSDVKRGMHSGENTNFSAINHDTCPLMPIAKAFWGDAIFRTELATIVEGVKNCTILEIASW